MKKLTLITVSIMLASLAVAADVVIGDLSQTPTWEGTTPNLYAVFGSVTPSADPFVTVWTLAGADTVTLPFKDKGTFDCTVDWGDGSNSTITAWDDADKTHSYAGGGTYTNTISGTMGSWYFDDGGDKLLIVAIEQWGDVGIDKAGFRSALYGCANLLSVPYEFPWNHLTYMNETFRACGITSSIPDLSVCTLLIDVSSLCRESSGFTGSIPDLSGCADLTTLFYAFFGDTGLTGSMFDMGGLGKVTTLAGAMRNCSGVTNGIMTRIPPLCTTADNVYQGMSLLVGDISTITNDITCTKFGAQDANNLTYESTGGMLSTNVPHGYAFNMGGCNLLAAYVDNILVDLDTSTASNLVVLLSGDNAAPTVVGQTAKTNIVARLGTVTVTVE